MEQRFLFREDLAERHLEQHIRRLLEVHRLVCFEKLCRDADAPAGAVRAHLEAMIERREVERLRPWRYEKEDLDYYQLLESQRPVSALVWNRRRLDSRRGWLDRVQLNLRPPSWARHDKRLVKSLT